VIVTTCPPHRDVIAPPHGPQAEATCAKCGRKKLYATALAEAFQITARQHRVTHREKLVLAIRR